MRLPRRRNASTRPVREQVVVIAGGSSGIGRETARQLGARGASVVVAGRNGEALRAAVDEVEERGGRGLAVVTDVTESPQVEELARRSVESFGRIDTWVNAAAVSAYGELADMPVDEIVRVVEIGLLGQLHGVKAALPILRRQGAGTIIGVSSVFGVRAVPLQVPYSVAKHGVTALYEGLRLEEQRRGSGVKVSVVMPSSINTPLYDNARSWMGSRPRPVPPVYEPAVVARALVAVAGKPRRHVVVGGSGAQLYALQRLSPALVDRLFMVGDAFFQLQQRAEPDGGQSNLHHPSAGEGAVDGAFGRHSLRHSAYTATVGLHPGVARAVTTVAATAAVGRGRWRM